MLRGSIAEANAWTRLINAAYVDSNNLNEQQWLVAIFLS